MSDIAFLCHPTVGHLNTLLSMALRLSTDGHSARFYIPGKRSPGFRLKPDILNNVIDVPAAVEKAGLPVALLELPLGTAFHALFLPWTRGLAETRRALALFSAGLEPLTRNILRRLERKPPDAMVIDFAFFAAQLAAEKLGVPYATVYHSGLPFRGPGVPPFGSGLPIGGIGPELARAEAVVREILGDTHRRVEAARGALGLRPGSAPSDMLGRPSSPWLNLVTSHESIEAPRGDLGPTCFYVGPCFATRRKLAEEPFPFERLRERDYKIYVSLGTVFNNRPGVFRTLLVALEQPGVQVVVSAGASYPRLARGRLPGNVLLFRRVPQLDVLPRVDLVVGHGGNNSTNETLAAGKPLLVIPSGGEQRDNARRVEYLGAGLSLLPEQLGVDDVRRTVARLRSELHFVERAQTLQRVLAETDGAEVSARLILLLAQRKTPLRLPEGARRSVSRDGLERLVASLQAVA